MMNKKIASITAILLVAVAVASFIVIAADRETPPAILDDERFEGAYDYPITGEKTPDIWIELKGIEEKYAAVSIPEDILRDMSTDALVKTCILYPLFGNIFAFNSYEDGFQRIYDNFNGMRELFCREDAGACLLNVYEQLTPEGVMEHLSYTVLRMNYIDILMNEAIKAGLFTDIEKERLLVNVKNKLEDYILNYENVFMTNFAEMLIQILTN